VGGQSELVTPQCGFLIPVQTGENQAETYAAILKDLIQNKAKRRSMGESSRQRILNGFSLDAMGDRMAELFEEVSRLKQIGALAAPHLSSEDKLSRETQHVVEYLQARNEWRQLNSRHLDLMQQYADLSDQYFAMLQPKPASHWFYLWIRQLLLPINANIRHSTIGQTAINVQKWLKQKLVRG
jgi:hypothetical protein